MMTRIAMTVAVVSLFAAAPAFAQGETPAPKEQKAVKAAKGSPQTHHCYKDGKLLADVTKKKCAGEGGKWDKDSAHAAKAEPAKAEPAKADAPNPEASPAPAAEPGKAL